MAGTDFIPGREAELLAVSANVKGRLTAGPTAYLQYGLTEAISDAFVLKHDAFAAAYAVVQDPETRSPVNVTLKNDAKKLLVADLRLVARIVQASPSVGNSRKQALGLKIRDTEPSPINPPTTAPLIEIVNTSGRTLTIKLRDADTSRRGKGPGISGATLLSYVGATPPSSIDEWRFEANTTRTTFELTFPPTVAAGSTVFITAFWRNPRDMSGPAAQPISTNLGGGLSMAA